jgi:hypothetical protein
LRAFSVAGIDRDDEPIRIHEQCLHLPICGDLLKQLPAVINFHRVQDLSPGTAHETIIPRAGA